MTRMPGVKTGKVYNAAARRRKDKKGDGVFRCDRCDRVHSEFDMITQDGLRLCKEYCADLTSKSELMQIYSAELGVVDSFEPVEFPVTPAQQGAVAITAISPSFPIQKNDLSGSFTITLTGVNLSSSDTIKFVELDGTENDWSSYISYTSTTSATVTVDPDWDGPFGHSPNTWYTFEYNGQRFFKALYIQGKAVVP